MNINFYSSKLPFCDSVSSNSSSINLESVSDHLHSDPETSFSYTSPLELNLDDFHLKNFFQLLANMCLSSYTSDLDLEGMNHWVALNFLKTLFFSLLKKENQFLIQEEDVFLLEKWKDIIDGLTQTGFEGKSFKEKAEIARNKIQNLSIDQDFVFPIAWHVNNSGHAMIIRFNKTEQEKINIYIYNAQEGSYGLQEGSTVLGKRETVPFFYFSQVPLKELFLEDTIELFGEEGKLSILENLFEFERLRRADEKVSIQDLLILFAPVMQYKKSYGKQTPLISCQKRGNCTIKSFNSLLLHLIGCKTTYKKINIDMRLHVLKTGMQLLTENCVPGCLSKSDVAYLLRRGIENLQLILLRNDKVLDSSLLEKSHEMVTNLMNYLEGESKKIQKNSVFFPLASEDCLAPIFRAEKSKNYEAESEKKIEKKR